MSFQQLPEVFYDNKTAREKLGMTRDTFNHYVKTGAITPTKIIGKYRYFAKSEIDLLARSIQTAILTAKSPHIQFKKATLDQQEEELKLAELTFGERTKAFHQYRRQLLEINPDMSYYLYDGKHMTASINIVPLSHEGILKFKEGERGWLMGDYIEQLKPGKVELIIIDMMTTPLAPANRRKVYAVRLLLGLEAVLIDWAHQGIEIVSIHACGGTPDGREILENAHFVYLGEPRPNRHIYELEIATSGLHILEPYREALQAYKEKHSVDAVQ